MAWGKLDIIIDSPLAADFTAGYAKLRDHWDAEAKAKLVGYSAHADQKDLLNFVGRMRHKSRQIRLVHGDAGAKEALPKLLSGLYSGMEVLVA